MKEIRVTPMDLMLYGALINAGIGLLLGLIPMITGVVKRNVKYGIFGLLGSIVGGAILGFILSIPVSALFTWLIIRGPKTPANIPADSRSGNSETP